MYDVTVLLVPPFAAARMQPATHDADEQWQRCGVSARQMTLVAETDRRNE